MEMNSVQQDFILNIQSKMSLSKNIILILLLFVFIAGCGRKKIFTTVEMNWKPMNSINKDLPIGIKIFRGNNNLIPVKAWYANIDLSSNSNNIRIVQSHDSDRRETLSEFSEKLNAVVLVNGGYFLMDNNPTEHVGLLMTNHTIHSRALSSLLRGESRYFVTRGAMGITDQNQVDIAWVTSRNDSVFEWTNPVENSPNMPNNLLEYSQSIHWNIRDAIQAGPVLINNSKINISIENEVFFDTKIPEINPRTAAGYTSDGKLILMVVDGRQAMSRGVYLEELAIMMHDLGCIEAINLDGGGSSSIVVNGSLLNKPSGTNIQREVMSAIAVFSQQ